MTQRVVRTSQEPSWRSVERRLLIEKLMRSHLSHDTWLSNSDTTLHVESLIWPKPFLSGFLHSQTTLASYHFFFLHPHFFTERETVPVRMSSDWLEVGTKFGHSTANPYPQQRGRPNELRIQYQECVREAIDAEWVCREAGAGDTKYECLGSSLLHFASQRW